MTTGDNEALIRRWLDAESAGDIEAVLACFSEDIVYHHLHFQPVDLPGGKRQVSDRTGATGGGGLRESSGRDG